MIGSRLCELAGIEYPIFQGGMAWVANASLASAVSNAGGLGIIAAMNSNAQQLRAEISKCRNMTEKPFGVNIMLMSPFADEVAEVVAEEKIPVVTTGAGHPSTSRARWRAAGIKVIPVGPSVARATMVVRRGAAAVVAEGGESGGHVGDLTTMTLVPQVCDAVDVPVIAAGGIGDGRGVAASFMLGACGVQVGTRFLVAKECTIHQNYKNKVLSARDIDTMTTGKRFGHPVRCLKNDFSRMLLENEYEPGMTAEQFEKLGVGALRKAVLDGDVAAGSFMCGQIAGMVNKEQTCREIIEEMFSRAEALLKGAAQWVK